MFLVTTSKRHQDCKRAKQLLYTIGFKTEKQILEIKLDDFGEELERAHLVADGFGGQNKNRIMVGIIQFWVQFCSPSHIKCVRLAYPVVEHPFLPCLLKYRKKPKNPVKSLIQKHAFTLLETIPQG
nr:unnamed protein product [Callosobruchus analis]